MNEFSHLDAGGSARMVDVGAKPAQRRIAVASARLCCRRETLDALRERALPKGDALTVARIAGIQAAKATAQWIPLCHTLPLDHVAVDFSIGTDAIDIRCEARTRAATGVEMEALTGATAAALALYDMMKAVDQGMRIENIAVLRKEKS